MNRSESINELVAALSKAQAEMENADKDATNPHFGKSYADLASVWDACRVPLTKNGLSVIQPVSYEDGNVIVSTILAHPSGQFIECSLAMRPRDGSPQAIGSAITYGRRYSLMAMVGVAPEGDDDGNGAQPDEGDNRNENRTPSKPAVKKPASTPTAVKPSSKPAVKPAEPATSPPPVLPTPDGPKKEWHPEEKHLKALFATAHASGWTTADCKSWLISHFRIESSKLMTRPQFDEMINHIKTHPKSDASEPMTEVVTENETDDSIPY